MSKSNKILSYIQILVIVCMMLCNDGIRVTSVTKSEDFPCKGHRCGCKLESDCKVHCCCELYKNQDKFRDNNSEQKNSFRVFISSINCKYGSDPLTSITFTAKYILENQVQPIKESFLCFLFHDISSDLLEVFLSPPGKPPRHFI